MSLTMEDIDRQVEESPMSYEEAKKQFVEQTEKLGIKHAFKFDEAWQIGMELRERQSHRNKLVNFEQEFVKAEGVKTGDELMEVNPLKHTFADGCYVREIFNPANQLLVTKIHKKKHPFFLMKGEMSILTEKGVERISAPHHGITVPGTKRVIYTHTDCVFVTVHATKKDTVEEVEEEVIAKNFDDPEISLHEMKLLMEVEQ